MNQNPYSPPNCVTDLNGHRSICKILMSRFSIAYVAASIIGLFVILAWTQGVSTAVSENANQGSATIIAFYAVVASVLSIIYCPKSNHRYNWLVRLSGGFVIWFAISATETLLIESPNSYSAEVIKLSSLTTAFVVSVATQMLLSTLLGRFSGPSKQTTAG